MHKAEIRKTASLCKSELVNKALVGKHALGAVRVIRRTELPIGRAGTATGHTVTATAPRPPHRVANRNVDGVRRKRETPARPDGHIDNRAGRRWRAARHWPSVLIHN